MAWQHSGGARQARSTRAGQPDAAQLHLVTLLHQPAAALGLPPELDAARVCVPPQHPVEQLRGIHGLCEGATVQAGGRAAAAAAVVPLEASRLIECLGAATRGCTGAGGGQEGSKGLGDVRCPVGPGRHPGRLAHSAEDAMRQGLLAAAAGRRERTRSKVSCA